MKKLLFPIALLSLTYGSVHAQIVRNINLNKVADAAGKGVKGATLSDAEVEELSADAVRWMEGRCASRRPAKMRTSN